MSDRSTLKFNETMYKASFAGFVDVDLADKKLSLRSLVTSLSIVNQKSKRTFESKLLKFFL